MADPEHLPSVDELQFRRAQPIDRTEIQTGRACEACKHLITGEYYQVQNHVICPQCAAKIQAGRQAQRPVPWVRFVIFGAGAALAGSVLYAIPLALGFQIGIVALAVGWMVGKAIRAGSYGTGGRPQQILAVVLTYFAISTSFFPAALFLRAKHSIEGQSEVKKPASAPSMHDQVTTNPQTMSAGKAIASLLVFAVIFPFLELKSSPAGGLISLFILFIGLQRAWVMTARREIMVTGPYS